MRKGNKMLKINTVTKYEVIHKGNSHTFNSMEDIIEFITVNFELKITWERACKI